MTQAFKMFSNLPKNVLTEYPSGKFGFVGKVDARLCFQDEKGDCPPEEIINEIKRSSSPSLVMKLRGVRYRVFETEKEAKEFLKNLDVILVRKDKF